MVNKRMSQNPDPAMSDFKAQDMWKASNLRKTMPDFSKGQEPLPERQTVDGVVLP